MKTWFQNRRAKWRRLKQDGQDGDGENQEAKQNKRKKEASDDDNSSAEDDSSPPNKDKEPEEDKDEVVSVDMNLSESKNADNFTVHKLNSPNTSFSASHLVDSPVNGFGGVKEPLNNIVSPHFQTPSYTCTTVGSYHRVSPLNSLGQPFYSNQVLHHPQPYHPAPYHPSPDYQTPLYSSHLPQTLSSMNNVPHYEPYATVYTSGQSLPSGPTSALSIEPSPE